LNTPTLGFRVVNPKPAGNSIAFTEISTSLYLKENRYMAKLNFNCIYCTSSFDLITDLFRHYEAEHRNLGFKSYSITHRPSKEKGHATAPNPEQACLRLCWELKDCDVKEALITDSFAK